MLMFDEYKLKHDVDIFILQYILEAECKWTQICYKNCTQENLIIWDHRYELLQ